MSSCRARVTSRSLDERFCRQNHIRRRAFFGSVIRDDFTPESDIDVLVEFEEGHVSGLDFFAMQRQLSEILGRPVDLHTPGFLSPYFRDEVLSKAENLYVAHEPHLRTGTLESPTSEPAG